MPSSIEDDAVSYYTVDSMDTFDTDALFADDDEDLAAALSLMTEEEKARTTAECKQQHLQQQRQGEGGVGCSATSSGGTTEEVSSDDIDDSTDDDDDDSISVDSEMNRINMQRSFNNSSRLFNEDSINKKLTDVSPTYPRRTYSVSPPVDLCVTFPNDDEGDDELQDQQQLEEVHHVECVLNMLESEEEFAIVWVTREELKSTMDECTATVKALRGSNHGGDSNNDDKEGRSAGGGSLTQTEIGDTSSFLVAKMKQDDGELTDRGLEYVTEFGFDMSKNSKPIVQAVLQTQQRLLKEKKVESAATASENDVQQQQQDEFSRQQPRPP